MPGFDRTGPAGQGPGTGWGRGLCYSSAGGRRFSLTGALWGAGRGGAPWGWGRGRGFGGRGWGLRPSWRLWPWSWGAARVSSSDEAEILRAELSAAKEEIAAMEARLSELDKKES